MWNKNVLNNLALRSIRKERIYQAIITDLALASVLPKEKAEVLLGYEIPDYLELPDGTSFKDKKVTVEKKPDLSKLKDL